MSMHKALPSRKDIDGLYVTRKEKGKEHVNIEDSLDTTIEKLEEYVNKSKAACNNNYNNKKNLE